MRDRKYIGVYIAEGVCIDVFTVVMLLLLLQQVTCKLFSTCTVHSSFEKLQAVLNFGNVSSTKLPGEFEIPVAHVELHFKKAESVFHRVCSLIGFHSDLNWNVFSDSVEVIPH